MTTTLIVPGADIQDTMVTVKEYVPVANVVALVMVGFCKVLVKPFGPVHDQVAVPDVAVVAPNVNVLPLQIGVLLVKTGVIGGLGSTNV